MYGPDGKPLSSTEKASLTVDARGYVVTASGEVVRDEKGDPVQSTVRVGAGISLGNEDLGASGIAHVGGTVHHGATKRGAGGLAGVTAEGHFETEAIDMSADATAEVGVSATIVRNEAGECGTIYEAEFTVSVEAAAEIDTPLPGDTDLVVGVDIEYEKSIHHVVDTPSLVCDIAGVDDPQALADAADLAPGSGRIAEQQGYTMIEDQDRGYSARIDESGFVTLYDKDLNEIDHTDARAMSDAMERMPDSLKFNLGLLEESERLAERVQQERERQEAQERQRERELAQDRSWQRESARSNEYGMDR
ncbi:hypothetical protein OAS86_06620 [Gammaproteobacteria bacterium]|nr:hypothetical protein [Gammaproteobacteria bacterium]